MAGRVPVLMRQILELPVQRVAKAAAGPLRARGALGDPAVDRAADGEVGETDALTCGQFGGVAGAPADDRADTFGASGTSWTGRPGPDDGQQSQGPAAGALPGA